MWVGRFYTVESLAQHYSSPPLYHPALWLYPSPLPLSPRLTLPPLPSTPYFLLSLPFLLSPLLPTFSPSYPSSSLLSSIAYFPSPIYLTSVFIIPYYLTRPVLPLSLPFFKVRERKEESLKERQSANEDEDNDRVY